MIRLTAILTRRAEVGASYVPFKNVYTALEYFDGKNLATDRDANTLFGRVVTLPFHQQESYSAIKRPFLRGGR